MTKPRTHASSEQLRVVGIGASAGGLEALKELLGAMPVDSGMAFVIVQHLDPAHESRMAEILSKSTAMSVMLAEDGMAVEPNTVYTNPPGRTLSIRQGQLALGGFTKEAHVEAAIDHFLISLAADQGARAVCIILSGSSGLDGPGGVRAIRAAGGMCMVQEPTTAQFPAMPQAAIDTGLVDYVLKPSRMPVALVDFALHQQGLAAGREEPADAAASSEMDAILKLLRTHANSDYSHYKRTTVLRRIQRRMGLRQISDLAAYVMLLQTDADELAQLAKDMLIGVSSFFRDAKVFETLRSEILAPLIATRKDDLLFRAWVAGCATGEEAYSIAMLLLEEREAAGKTFPLLVFATDIDEQALETARTGTYPLEIAEQVSAERLERFFTADDQGYQVDKHLREAVVFSRHNLLADPPFSKLDLVSCRNVLIYLEPAAQKKVLSVFSFALKTGGWLLLGRSEGIAGLENLFEPFAKQDRIFRLLRSCRRAVGEFPLQAAGQPVAGRHRERAGGDVSILPQANLDALLRHFDASVVLIDAEGTILYFHGRTEKYLGHPKGPASLNILDLTDGTLSAKLRRAIKKALQQDEPIRLAHLNMPRNGSPPTNLTVLAVGDQPGVGRLLAVVFEDAQPHPHPSTTHAVSADDGPLVAQLEAEVKELRTELRSNEEGYDAALEELKVANEEVMSMNEELQSANEELEASKEELQSVNAQLNEKVTELTEANNDLANLLTATEIATVFLDTELRIRKFTPRATQLLNLIASDLGRPVGHITQKFTGLDLAADAATVIADLLPSEKEVQASDGRWYTVRILPYRTLDNRIDGAVVTFSDVTRLKRTEGELRSEKMFAEQIIETVRQPLLVLDEKLWILSANQAFYETFEVEAKDTAGRQIYELGNGQWDIPQLRTLLEEVVPRQAAFQDFRVEHLFQQIGQKVMMVSGRRIQPTDAGPTRLLLTIEDITAREKAREELGDLNLDLEQRVTERTALAEHRSVQLRQLAAELAHSEQRERERLARLLHDDLQQLLVAAKLQLVIARFRSPDERSRQSVDLAMQLLDQSLESSRSLTVELSPTILYDGGLEAALPWLARQNEARHDLKVETEINAAVPQDEAGVAYLLFSAVRELLLNVVKHAGVDAARVQLDRLDDDRVRVIVSDEGKGFDPASLESNDGTTGLGLFGLQERLGHIGGDCVIDSAPGRGTRITLTAKVAEPTEPPNPAPLLKQPAIAAPPARKQSDARIRVLIADDHAIVRQGLVGILNAESDIVVVAEAENGRQAVEQARRHHPDVIIMDVNMPDMKGTKATKLISSELPAIRIIGLSMFAEADRAEAMREAGAVGYLSKGGSSQALLAAIRRLK